VELQFYCHVQPRAALELARTRSTPRTRSPARWLVLSHTLWNSLTLSSSRTHTLELLCTRSFSLVHLLARTLSNSPKLAQTHSPSHARPSARTRSNSLTFCRTFSGSRSPGAAKPFSFHSLPSCYSSNACICCVATKFCENILSRRCDRKIPVPICTLARIPGLLYMSPCKISAKSDYCDLTNLS